MRDISETELQTHHSDGTVVRVVGSLPSAGWYEKMPEGWKGGG